MFQKYTKGNYSLHIAFTCCPDCADKLKLQQLALSKDLYVERRKLNNTIIVTVIHGKIERVISKFELQALTNTYIF